MSLDLSIGPPPPRCESCRCLLPYHNPGCVDPTYEVIICDDLLDDAPTPALTPPKRAEMMEWWEGAKRDLGLVTTTSYSRDGRASFTTARRPEK